MTTVTIAETTASKRTRSKKADLNSTTSNTPVTNVTVAEDLTKPEVNPELESIRKDVIDDAHKIAEAVAPIVAAKVMEQVEGSLANMSQTAPVATERKVREPKDKRVQALEFIANGWASGMIRSKIVEGLAAKMGITSANAAYYVDRVAPKPAKRVVGNTGTTTAEQPQPESTEAQEGQGGTEPQEPTSDELMAEVEGDTEA